MRNTEGNINNNKIRKIALIFDSYSDIPIGGEPAINFNLYKYLKNNGYEIDIYCNKNYSIYEEKNIHSWFNKNLTDNIKIINGRDYDAIIADRFALNYADLNCDVYTIHAHSTNYSQKSKLGIFYPFSPKNK